MQEKQESMIYFALDQQVQRSAHHPKVEVEVVELDEMTWILQESRGGEIESKKVKKGFDVRFDIFDRYINFTFLAAEVCDDTAEQTIEQGCDNIEMWWVLSCSLQEYKV